MSLYNMIMGVCPLADTFIACAGMNPEIVMKNGEFRFRDCYLSEDGTEILLYTRIGGPNREDHAAAIELLRGAPTYLGDENDEFDHTFATFRFRPHGELAQTIMRRAHEMGVSGSERPAKMRAMLEASRNNDDSQGLITELREKTKSLAEGMASALRGTAGTVSVETKEGYGVEIVKLGPDGEIPTPIREETPDV